MSLSVVILAAGQGSRMNSNIPKVLQPVGGKPLLGHILDRAERLAPKQIIVVAGCAQAALKQAFGKRKIDWVQQPEPRGTADAVKCALPYIPAQHQVLILVADVPLLALKTLEDLIEFTPEDGLGLITACVEKPLGLGRIIRDNNQAVLSIVEEKDATPKQRAIQEIHAGIFYLSQTLLGESLNKIQPQNRQGEYYLTDLVALAVAAGKPICAIAPQDQIEVLGANTQAELALLERAYQKQQVNAFLKTGVRFMDPARVDLRDAQIEHGQGICIDVNVILEGKLVLGDAVSIGANCIIKNSVIKEQVQILPNSLIENAVIEKKSVIGPFARIRPKTHILENSRVGNFVEMKKTTFGPDSKANHLSYLGDASIGRFVNIGAGTITCNYNGVDKFETIIKDNVFVGSDTQLVAPVCVEEGATIGAGTTVLQDPPAQKLTVNKKEQIIVENWVRPEKKSEKEQT